MAKVIHIFEIENSVMTDRGYQDLGTSEMAQFAAINVGMNDSTDMLVNWQIFADD